MQELVEYTAALVRYCMRMQNKVSISQVPTELEVAASAKGLVESDRKVGGSLLEKIVYSLLTGGKAHEKDPKKIAKRNVPAVYYSSAHAMVLRICGENVGESLALFFKSCKKR